ncbi:MAG: sugar phosphate isomerase/epimerase [Acidobacteria bacterium]|nr:MAG: sugar phosphate isomerase/epimerase [Acidobacteriota bacterium]
MEFALSTHLFVSDRLGSYLLDQIYAAGIRQFEIFAARQHLDYHDPNQVRDVGLWFKDRGVRLHSLHAPLFADFDWGRSGGLPISLTYLEKRLRINSMDEIKRAIDISEQLPFRYLVVHLGLPDEEFDMRKFDAALTSVEHLKLFARGRGVQLLLENIPNDLAAPARLIQFIQYTRLEDLKICFDTGHAHMTGGVQPAFDLLKNRIVSTHVHDNQREKDDHLFPFDGGIDWEQTIRDFRTVDGQFPIVFELRHYSPEASSLARLRQVIERIEAIR